MKAEEVVAWREALIKLSDQHFFDLMRMYLGAIKTPFNKQRLIEELSSFLRKKENRDKIVFCLDDLDVLILAAINELPSPTQPKIIKLFSNSHSFPVLYERILNLEERLLIYRKNDTEKREYTINPLLRDDLQARLGLALLVPPVFRGEECHAPLRIDDLLLAAMYSFFFHEGEAVKNDGSFRKKTITALESIFSQLYTHPDCFPFLLSAFQNLGLLVKLDGRLVPDVARWNSFALITPAERIAYLVAAVGGRFQRDTLQRRSQVFLEFFVSMEKGARYTRETLTRLAFLLSEKSGNLPFVKSQGRFTSMIREQDAFETTAQDTGMDYAGIAFAFGLIVEQDGLWIQNSAALSSSSIPPLSPYLVVSPTFSVTLMPGYSLSDLLSIVLCMEVRDIQIAGQFEITRKACIAAFDQGATTETVLALFRSKSTQSIPQNVVFSIQDWYRNFSSISLYHGYVLRVDENRRVQFENNEHLSSLIRKILAPGVYLLDAESPEQIQEIFDRADIDFLPSISSPAPKREAMPLPPLFLPAPEQKSLEIPQLLQNEKDRLENRTALIALLDSRKLDPDLHDALKSRIDRKIVINAEQLDPDSVRIEKVEARGMDFLGKVRIAEYALASGSMLELVLDEKEGNRIILGRPVSTEKKPGVVLLKILTEPDQVIEQVSLGKAAMVRRIRGSIFSEPSGNRSPDGKA